MLELEQNLTKKETTITLRQVTIVDNDNIDTPQINITDYDPDEDDDFGFNP